MESDARLVINAQRVAHQLIDGEAIIIDYETGAYYSTDKAGAEVWGWIAGGASLGQIVEALAARYAGDRTAIATAVRLFVEDLQREALVEPVTGEAGEHSIDLSPGTPGNRATFEAPVLSKYTDMEDLLMLDPIHQVDQSGWPAKSPRMRG